MKKLFKKIQNNRFILVESAWKDTQENNEKINKFRRILKYNQEYFNAVLQSPLSDDKDKQMANDGIKLSEEFDNIITKGYLDSGYQFDDNDSRNQLDLGGDDSYFDRHAARTGSSMEDEVESEIRQTILNRKVIEKFDIYNKYFDRKKAQELFSNLPEDKSHLEEFSDYSLQEYINEQINNSYNHDDYD